MAGKVGKAIGRARSAAKKMIGARTGKASTPKIAAKKSSHARAPARPAKAAKRARGTPVKSSPSNTTVKRSKPRAAHVASTPPRTTVAPPAARMMPTRPAAPPQKPAASQKAAVAQNQTAPAPAKHLSHAAQKRLAGEHLRALLEQKKHRATQTPAWQKIEHHDHEPREADHRPHGGGAVGDGSEAAPDPDDRGEN